MMEEAVIELKRMNKLLVLMLTKDMEQIQKIELLSHCGFKLKEIAELTGVKNTVVNATLYRLKSKK
jgi:hypothetical protein